MSEGEPGAAISRPTFQRQVWFWLGVLFVFALVLYVLSGILLPFVAGMALAYLLDPVADWFERRGIGRLAATLTILALFLVVFLVVLVTLVPALVNQLVGLIERLPDLVLQLQALLEPLLESDLAQSLGLDADQLRTSLGASVGEGAGWLLGILGSIWNGGVALVAVLSLLLVTPLVAFYLLYDWDRMTARIDSWLPRDHAPAIRELTGQMSRAIAGFVRGQGLVCLILGAFYAIALASIGLNFGLLIGLGAGLLSFVPFVGTALGLAASVGVATVQFWPDWIWIAVTAGIFVVGQMLEGYVLQPRLVGGSVGLHPVWVMFALFAFSLVFGFVGALIAVPAAAIIAVLVRYALFRYLASPYYRGGDAGAEPEAGGRR